MGVEHGHLARAVVPNTEVEATAEVRSPLKVRHGVAMQVVAMLAVAQVLFLQPSDWVLYLRREILAGFLYFVR